MNPLVVVDSSVFINYLRGESDDTFVVLVLQNQVLLSPVVKLELFSGVRKKEFHLLEKLCNNLRPIPAFAPVALCEKLLSQARGSGLLGGVPDVLIIADALRYKAFLFSYDKKMNMLAKKLGVKILANKKA